MGLLNKNNAEIIDMPVDYQEASICSHKVL